MPDNLAPAILLITAGGIMIYSSAKGIGIVDVLAGVTGQGLDPAAVNKAITKSPGSDAAQSDSSNSSTSGLTPKQIIDTYVLPVARNAGIDVTPESVTAANNRHGATVDGGRSDHQGPPDEAWAADMSNGQRPTPEMDELARRLAKAFGLNWTGSGIVSITHGGYRYQMIYRSLVGGNHYNHVHFGVKRVG